MSKIAMVIVAIVVAGVVTAGLGYISLEDIGKDIDNLAGNTAIVIDDIVDPKTDEEKFVRAVNHDIAEFEKEVEEVMEILLPPPEEYIKDIEEILEPVDEVIDDTISELDDTIGFIADDIEDLFGWL